MAVVAVAATAASARAHERMTLDEAIERALRRDERARTAVVQRAQAERAAGRALTIMGPTARLFGTLQFQNEIVLSFSGVPPQTIQPGRVELLGGEITQPLYVHEVWGRRESGKQVAAQSEAQLGRTREQVAVDTLGEYYDALKADRRVDLARTAVERAAAQVALAKARVAAGSAMRTALLQAEIDLDRYNRQVLDAEGTKRVARERLSVETGAPLEVALAEPGPQAAGAAALDQAVASAWQTRADARAADRAVAAAEADVAAARAHLYPSLVGSAAYTHNEPQALFTTPDAWRALITLSVPLLQNGSEYYDLRDKHSALSVAELNREALRKQIHVDVTRAYVAYETALRQVEVLERQLGFARENQALVIAQFRGGTANSTDVTVAQATLAEAELNVAVARYDREVAAAGVRFATGELRAELPAR
jgi:outer membrane protein